VSCHNCQTFQPFPLEDSTFFYKTVNFEGNTIENYEDLKEALNVVSQKGYCAKVVDDMTKVSN